MHNNPRDGYVVFIRLKALTARIEGESIFFKTEPDLNLQFSSVFCLQFFLTDALEEVRTVFETEAEGFRKRRLPLRRRC